MYKYVAFVWNKRSIPPLHGIKRIVRHFQRTSSTDWRCVVDQSGLLVYHSGDRDLGPRAHSLPGTRGVVLGSLFRSSCVDEDQIGTPCFDDREAQILVNTGGRRLVSDYWGSYVAFLYDDDRNRHFVLRDPTAALPCFALNYQGIDIYFSWMPDLADCDELQMTINLRFVAGYLLNNQLRVTESGLNEVQEVLAGQCVKLGDDGKKSEFYWDPRTIAQSDGYEDASEAARVLRTTTRACVRTWSSCYRKIVLELSGGLDSAIVLGCLSDPSDDAEIICLNLHTEHPDGDERQFARLAAHQAGRELFETSRALSDADIPRALATQRFASPNPYVLSSSFDDIYSQMAKDRGADAFFAGQGGDHLFHENKVSLIAADYLIRHGFNARFLRAVYTTSFFTQLSFWQVLREAISAGGLGRKWPLYTHLEERKMFLSSDALALLQDDYILHPWLKSGDGVAPAKFRQISTLVDFQSYYWPSGRAQYADVVYPLFSQPLVELCLRIPTYVLTVGGRDRGLARQSFVYDVPPEIIARRTKGTIGSYFTSMLSKNAKAIQEMLLDGELASGGIIDRTRIEAHLGVNQLERGEHLVQLMEFISTEIWLRSWKPERLRAVA